MADGLSQRVDNAEDLSALSQQYGTTRALAHQAQLWHVKPGKSKAATTSRILAAMQANQNEASQAERPQGAENNEDEEPNEDNDDEFDNLV